MSRVLWIITIKIRKRAGRDLYEMQCGGRFYNRVPLEGRGGVRKGRAASGGFPDVGTLHDRESGFRVKESTHHKIGCDQDKGNNRATLAPWFLGFCSDFFGDQTKQFGNENSH